MISAGPHPNGSPSHMRLKAPPALELPPDVVHPPVQPLDGSSDISNIVAGDRPCLIRRQSRWASFTPRVWTIWQPIPLVA
jgi:hypothetical protein